MRKFLLLLTSGILVLGFLVLAIDKLQIKTEPVNKINKVVQSTTPSAKPNITTIVADFGTKKVEATISAKTAFEALKLLTKENNLILKTKQYDFGVFVESIGGIANTKDKSWIYFVNGKSAKVAADKYLLKNGDLIEWKYIKPNF